MQEKFDDTLMICEKNFVLKFVEVFSQSIIIVNRIKCVGPIFK